MIHTDLQLPFTDLQLPPSILASEHLLTIGKLPNL